MAVLAGTLATLESQGLTERSLGRARWAVARELTVAGATSPELAERLTERVLAGRDPASIDADFEALARVDSEQLLASWRQCRGSMVLSVVGDEAAVRAALAEAKLPSTPR